MAACMYSLMMEPAPKLEQTSRSTCSNSRPSGETFSCSPQVQGSVQAGHLDAIQQDEFLTCAHQQRHLPTDAYEHGTCLSPLPAPDPDVDAADRSADSASEASGGGSPAAGSAPPPPPPLSGEPDRAVPPVWLWVSDIKGQRRRIFWGHQRFDEGFTS